MTSPETILELEDLDGSEVLEERKSLLAAASSAPSVLMLTGTHGVVVPPMVRPDGRLPAASAFAPKDAELAPREGEGPVLGLLRARALAADADDDAVGRARAHLERARALADEGRDDEAREAVTAARAASPSVDVAAELHAHALGLGRTGLDAQIDTVTRVVEGTADDRTRADFLVERARLLEARGAEGDLEAAIADGRRALAIVHAHPAALYALEGLLERTADHAGLAEHLRRVADLGGASAGAAHLHVERALVLEMRLADLAGARAAFEQALALAPSDADVRAACIDCAVRHGDDAWLASLLEGAAEGQTGAAAAGLLFDAALASLRAGGETRHAQRLLERAHGYFPTSPALDERIGDELARLYDELGRDADALRVRKTLLRLAREPREEVTALRAVAVTAERANTLDEAVLALERARMLDPEDATLLDVLERILATLGRHEQRAVLWVREAATADRPEAKAKALLVAARASRSAGKEEEAGRHLRAAWLTAPDAPFVFDALRERLATTGADVSAHVKLYEQALRATHDPARRVAWLEKIAWLWDDVAGDTTKATAAYEAVLALDPTRRSALAGLASAAHRAGDPAALARALLADAAITADPKARASLELVAAQSLAESDADRALALAEKLVADEAVADDARALVVLLHERAGRHERAAAALAERRARSSLAARRVALALSEAATWMGRLGDPGRALTVLEEARATAPDDPAVALAMVDAAAALRDDERMRAVLRLLADGTRGAWRRSSLFVRLAELEERREGGLEPATKAYLDALEAAPGDTWIEARLARLGARGGPAVAYASPLRRALRELETDAADRRDGGVAAALLEAPSPSPFTARIAERLARRAGAAPLLANALALVATADVKVLAARALTGLAQVVAWSLPETEHLEPFDRLVLAGVDDVALLAAFSRRAASYVRAGDARVLGLALESARRRGARAGDGTEHTSALLERAALERRAGTPRAVLATCRETLAADPRSLLAAAWLAEAASQTADAEAGVLASTTFASLAVDPRARAALLGDAADLETARGRDEAAARLLASALEADADAVTIAARYADVQARRGAFAELAGVLGSALERARTEEAVVPMASELADVARTRLSDPLVAIAALERARGVSHGHMPSRLVLSELYIGERTWDAALAVLAEVVERSQEASEKLVARVGRAALLARAKGQRGEAETELRAALELDAHDPRALRMLLEVAKEMPAEEKASLLSRLAVSEPVPERRQKTLIALAKVRRELGDQDGTLGALVEAASISPDAAMLDQVRELTKGDDGAFQHVVSRAVARARDAGTGAGPAWLARLGQIEADVLGQHDAAAEHLREALESDPARSELRPLFVRVLVSTGKNEEAVRQGMPLLATPRAASHLDGVTLRLLEAALSGSGRPGEARVVRELRALGATMDARERAVLDAPRGALPDDPGALDLGFLRRLMPKLGGHPVWEVAVVARDLGAKLGRIALSDLGATPKDRVKPRAPHLLRAPFDRALRAFGLGEVELAVSENAQRVALAIEDVPWVVVPRRFEEASAQEVDAELARPLALLAVGVPWIDAFDPEDVLSAVVAVGRQVSAGFGGNLGARAEGLAADYELRARRALDRKKRRALEEMQDRLDAAPALDAVTFGEELVRLTTRVTFLVTGDLRASLAVLGRARPDSENKLRGGGPGALPALLGVPLARELVEVALDPRLTAQRRGLGLPVD